MSKKKKKTVVTKKTEKSLRTVLNRIINYSALYLPSKDNPELYKVPDPIISFYKNQFDIPDLDVSTIEILYTSSGELFGYYHVDNERQVTFVLFKSTKDVSKQIFTLKNICDNLTNEKDYNVAVRGILLPNHVFYDNYISEELLEKYKGYVCDVCFYSKLDTCRGSLLLDNKLVHYYERPFLTKYLDDESYNRDLFFDIRKYECVFDNDSFITTIYNKYKDIFETESFFKDRKPIKADGKINNFATDIITESYYGYDKICFILPDLSIDKLDKFLNNTFFKIMDEIGIDAVLFFERIRFYKSIKCDNDNDEKYDKSVHFVETEKIRSSTKFIEYSNDEVLRLFLTTS